MIYNGQIIEELAYILHIINMTIISPQLGNELKNKFLLLPKTLLPLY